MKKTKAGIFAVLLFQAAILIGVSFVTSKIIQEVNEHGLKNIIIEIWEGPNE